MHLIFFFLLFFTIVSGQCPSNGDLIFTKNNQTYFTISSNQTCVCRNYSGDGSSLTGLENQQIISNLISEISALTSQVSALTDQLNSFQQNISILISSLEQNTSAQISSLQSQISALNQSVRFSSVDSTQRTFAAGVSTPAIYENVIYDTHHAYDTNLGIYTIPINGTYHIEASLGLSIGESKGYYSQFDITVNSICSINDLAETFSNGVTSGLTSPLSFFLSGDLELKKGDTVLICMLQNSGSDVTEVVDPSKNQMHLFSIEIDQ